MHCGTTGVAAVVREKTIHVAWLGDSQALLVRNGQAVEIMNPHKPEREVSMNYGQLFISLTISCKSK